MSASAAPLVSGPVAHPFDVVVANVYGSVSDFPAGPPKVMATDSFVDSLLADSAAWWSTNTGVEFDFARANSVVAVNSTCDSVMSDALAAMGMPSTSAYVDSGRDLLILQEGAGSSLCSGSDVGGEAYTVPSKGNVSAGGVFAAALGAVTSTSSADYGVLVTTVSHEFGHTIGLQHSDALDCSAMVSPGDDQIGPLWDGLYANQTDCWPVEYGDRSTVMGAETSAATSLNSLQRVYLGVPGPGDGPEVVDGPVSDETVTVGRSDVASSGVANGLVVESGGSMVGVDYRAPASNASGNPGVYVTLARNTGTGLYTDLVTPLGFTGVSGVGGISLISGPTDVALQPGDAYVTADGRVSVGVVSVDGATAQLMVSVNAAGVPGGVSISRAGSTLTAEIVSPSGPATAVYQWYRNGQPVGGATGQSLTVAPGDDAVYRVEATLTVPGVGSVTYASRGILADDDRLTATGTTMTLRFVDENGGPVDCTGHMVYLSVTTASGQTVSSSQQVWLTGMDTIGTCAVGTPLPVTGNYVVTVTNPLRLEMYWQPLSAPVTVAASGASLGLSVGFGDFGSAGNASATGEPILYPGVGEPGLPVTVSVTDAAGQPAAGVTVTLAASMPGVEFTPTQPVTDSNGLAYATLDWNLMAAPPAQNLDVKVTATASGLPAASTNILVNAEASGRLVGWFDTPTTVTANGTDTVTVHVRAWDENGVFLTNRPDLVSLSWLATTTGTASIDPVQWDWLTQSYTATIHSTRTTSGQVEINLASASGGAGAMTILFQTVTFKAGPLAMLMGVVNTLTAASDGGCDDATPSTVEVGVQPMDAYGNFVSLAGYGGGMAFSVPAGSPISFSSNPIVTTPVRVDQYSALQYLIPVTSSEPGSFMVTAATVDGSMSVMMGATFVDGPVDPAASRVSVDAGPRAADGTDAYTVTADLVTTCHLPLTQLGDFTGSSLGGNLVDEATGQTATGATVSDFTPDPTVPGRYTATVTSTVPAIDDLTVVYGSGYDFTTSTFTASTTPVNTTPIPLEFVPVVVAVPAIRQANASMIAGTATAAAGQTVPSRVVVTYPTTAGTGQVTADVTQGAWSAPTPTDAVDGPLTVVGVDGSGNQSATVAGRLDVTAPSAPVVTSVTDTSVSGTLPGPVDPGTTVVASWPDGSTSDPAAVTDGAWSIPVPSGTGCQVTVIAIDPAGNQSAAAQPPLDLCTAQPQTLTFDQPAVTVTFGDAGFTNRLTQVGAGGLTFSSSDPSVVTVDQSGQVRIVGVGQATISAVAAGVPDVWLEGSASYQVTVQPENLASAIITVAGSPTFTGAALTPPVTVTLGGAMLASPADFTLAYADNTNAGQASVTVTGTGNYTGIATTQFAITPRAVTLTIDPIGDQTTTGQPLTPPLVAHDGSTVLTPGTDYTATYGSNVGPGTATVTVTGVGNYAGSTATATFTITPAGQSAQPQTLGFGQSAVTVTYGDAPFTNQLTRTGTGSLSYTTSDPSVATVDPSGQVTITGVGQATITVVAAGVPDEWLAASASYSLTVQPKSLSSATVAVTGTPTYIGLALTPPVTVTVGGKTLTPPGDFTLTYSGNTNAGQASVTVTGAGNYTGTVSQAFTISPRAVTVTIDPIPNQLATGQPVTPPVVVRDGTRVLTLGADYTVSYADNTAPGTATVTVTGTGNYAGSTGSVSFTITAPQPQTLTFTQTTLVKAVTDPPFTNRLTQVGAGTVTFHSSDPSVATVTNDGVVTVIGAGQTTITATASAVPGVWLDATASYTLTVDSWGIALSPAVNVAFPDVTYGYSAVAPATITATNTGNQSTGDLSVTVTGTDASSFTVSSSTVSSLMVGGNGSFTVSPAAGLTAGVHTATINVAGDHGITASVTVTLTVGKADQTLTAPDVTAMVGDGGVTLTGWAHSTAGADSGPIMYIVADPGTTGATLTGDNLSYQSAGTAIIRAAAAGDANHNSATTTFQLTVTVPPNPLRFTGSPTFDLPPATVGAPISPVSVAGGVTGGTPPYLFTATGLPAGVVLSPAGVLSGTPTTACLAGTATITVTDASSSQQSITINYGTITGAPNSVSLVTSAISAVTGGTIAATVTVTDANGIPVGAGTRVTFTVNGQATLTATGSAGKASIQVATGGDGKAKVTVSDTTPETVSLTATLTGQNIPVFGVPITLTFLAAQPDPEQSSVAADKTTQTVGQAVTLTATVKDGRGIPQPDVPVSLVPDGQATFAKDTCTTGDGTNGTILGSCQVTVTDKKAETVNLSATVTLNNQPVTVQGSPVVTFTTGCVPGADPGCAYDPGVDNNHRTQVTVTADNQHVLDGTDVATVRVFDLYGNPADRPVTTTTDNDSLKIDATKTDGMGTTIINYTTTATSAITVDARVYVADWELTFIPQPGSNLAGDPAGVSAKSSPVTLSFIGQTAAAAPMIQQPLDGSSQSTSLVTVSGTSQPGSTVTIKVDGKPSTNDAGSPAVAVVGADSKWQTTVSLTTGKHTISASQTSPAGDTSPDSATVTITITPAITTVPPVVVETGGTIQPSLPWARLAIMMSIAAGLLLTLRRIIDRPSAKTTAGTRPSEK